MCGSLRGWAESCFDAECRLNDCVCCAGMQSLSRSVEASAETGSQWHHALVKGEGFSQ